MLNKIRSYIKRQKRKKKKKEKIFSFADKKENVKNVQFFRQMKRGQEKIYSVLTSICYAQPRRESSNQRNAFLKNLPAPSTARGWRLQAQRERERERERSKRRRRRR